ncbi:MAG TPA: sterol desaturase family protein [Gemmataceae bacterium]|nr:sterol desaturase family protein [Gemmataceae bacterium]
MDWKDTIDFWLMMLGWVAGLTVAFAVLTRLMPCNPGKSWWKNLRGAGTDLIYWFIVPLFLRLGRTFLFAAGVVVLCGGQQPQPFSVNEVPLWLQCLVIVVLQDVMLYGLHRAFHSRPAWKFHAIHHSPQVLDWMSTVRFHPLNNLFAFGLVNIAVLLMGFSPAALAILEPFNIIYSSMVHANLNWTFGPLRYVFASPVFHRWHHTSRDEGLNKNFASTFPLLDVVFGTFYMPSGKLPEQFGNGDDDFPAGFWGQFLYPFRRTKTPPPPLPRPQVRPGSQRKKKAA